MGSMSIGHWVIVLAIVALVFGTKRLRGVGQDLGSAIRDFKAGMKSEDEQSREPQPVAPAAPVAAAQADQEPARRDGR